MNVNWKSLFPFLLMLALASGIWLGHFLATFKNTNYESQRLAQQYSEVLTYIEDDYVDTVSLADLHEQAINDMINKLDPHTSFLPAREVALFASKLKKSFDGLGVEFTIFRDTLLALRILDKSPAQRGGLLPGDRLIKIDTTQIAGAMISYTEAFNLLRGPRDSEVVLHVSRMGRKEKITITRGKIITHPVEATFMLDSTTGYIKLARFASNAHSEVQASINTLLAKGMQQLVFDLRQNGGGLVDQAVKILDEFLAKGLVVVQTKGKSKIGNNSIKTERKGAFEKGSLILLIDENSASASELVAGAIQDYDRGVIIGRRSFGKGLVQRPIKLSDGSELRLTISRYYTPSGRCVQRPYNGDDDAYWNELSRRLKGGEFSNEDSVYYNDTLIYKTTNNRLVYGGGGVYPDIFVADDTIPSLFKLMNDANILTAIAAELAADFLLHSTTTSITGFMVQFRLNDTTINRIKRHCEELGITYNDQTFTSALPFLSKRIQSLTARSLWSENEFHLTMSDHDAMILKAQQVFNEPTYYQLLNSQ